ncbi:MAG: universal stress protein, partial [Myxococcota bacterium]|nr:universal stress protein [Myxococcota bacterium]
ALELASTHEASVHVLHVLKDLDRALKRRIVESPNETVIEEAIDADQAALLQAVKLEYGRLHAKGIPVNRCSLDLLVTGGQILDVLLQHVEDEKVDLVVVGTHGPQGLKERISGSRTEQLVHRAPCSVFVVKPSGYPYLRD